MQTLNAGGQFNDIKHLVSGVRGARVYETGDLEAGIWWVGTAMGLIDDIPTVDAMISRIVREAEELIRTRLPGMILSHAAVAAAGS
ncbi:2-nitropropane dioxygenase [Mycolicibacterium thermoresistibile ATCC 19527]|uniref:2-nitropropane dioxygenase n=1 Tax=Mycolicibacterium thermoresistibile (strain ATCC 19527 / DSM 44167 / CIP 105390 / JCM 6362 / NCTC 10409 / 316) TaxID=1078020 RepID=G7CAW7_MYCT3|nr:2-nitropropane dioxygenase [Mycolicibacterium thermoresistibile ATCC 19527]SNW19648.1 2-nitropropane dioxygenase [Mycolicibacterium thermoresistibile]